MSSPVKICAQMCGRYVAPAQKYRVNHVFSPMREAYVIPHGFSRRSGAYPKV